MQINVAQLLKEPVGAQRNYKVDELAGESDEDHVSGEVALTRTNRGILVSGALSADLKCTCSRCLCPVHVKVKFNMDDEFFPVSDMITGERTELAADDFIIGDDHILDLSEAFRQYMIMAQPTKILCRPDCPGICPVCGQELSKGNCGHADRSRDHRWDKLIQQEKESKV